MNDKDLIGLAMSFRRFSKTSIGKADEQDRKDLFAMMRPGERIVILSPLTGEDISTITKTKPTPVAVITDRTALTTWLDEHYSEQVETDYDITGTDEEIKDALLLHAPDLLREVKRIRPWAEKDLKARALEFGAPVGPSDEADIPGLAVERADSVLQVRLGDDSAPLLRDLFAHQYLGVDGTVVKEIELPS